MYCVIEAKQYEPIKGTTSHLGYYPTFRPHCETKNSWATQPASADLFVFSTYFLEYFSTFCCINF